MIRNIFRIPVSCKCQYSATAWLCYFTHDRIVKYCDHCVCVLVCLSVCLSVCLLAYLRITHLNFTTQHSTCLGHTTLKPAQSHYQWAVVCGRLILAVVFYCTSTVSDVHTGHVSLSLQDGGMGGKTDPAAPVQIDQQQYVWKYLQHGGLCQLAGAVCGLKQTKLVEVC